MNDFSEILKSIGIIYGSTTISSLLFNYIYYDRRIKKAFKNSKRKLKYKDLNLINKRDLKRLKNFCRFEKFCSIVFSSLPIVQFKFTKLNILRDPSKYEKFFDKQIEKINEEEIRTRREFLEEMYNEKEIPEDVMYKINNITDYLPSEDDYLKTKKLKRKVKKLKAMDFIEPYMNDSSYWN